MDLAPGELQTLRISFDPMYRSNKISEKMKQSVTVVCNMGPKVVPKNERAPQGVHPKKATLELVGNKDAEIGEREFQWGMAKADAAFEEAGGRTVVGFETELRFRS